MIIKIHFEEIRESDFVCILNNERSINLKTSYIEFLSKFFARVTVNNELWLMQMFKISVFLIGKCVRKMLLQ